MFFDDRKQAGELLAKELAPYKRAKDTIIVGLPRGGVVTADVIARELELPLDVICPRKIGAHFNPEFAIGAVTETGAATFNDEVVARLGISEAYISEQIQKESEKAKQRVELFRKNLGERELQDKIVIIVDDGLATGCTIQAAIESVKAEGAAKIVIAVPVAPPDTLEKIKETVDDIVCLHVPHNFFAVGQFYKHFDQVSDDEVIKIMERKR